MPRGTTPPPLVTSPLPSRSSAHPPQPLNARGSLWRPSHSPCVRRRLPCVSLPTCAQRGCRPSVGFVIRSEATHRVTQGNSFHLLRCSLFYSFLVGTSLGFGKQDTCHHVPGSGGREQAHWKHIQGEWNQTTRYEISALDRRCLFILIKGTREIFFFSFVVLFCDLNLFAALPFFLNN